jgi:hypothetical protein
MGLAAGSIHVYLNGGEAVNEINNFRISSFGRQLFLRRGQENAVWIIWRQGKG